MKNDERPSVVFLVGLPGSGKSTARLNAIKSGSAARSYIYSTDDLIDSFAFDMEMTYNEVFSDYISTATQLANEGLTAAIAEKQNVLWDQTNMSAKKRRKAMNRFPKEYRRECICILPPFTVEQQLELERRLASRPGKVIPRHIMASMLESFDLPSENEGFNRVMYFDINGNMVDRNDAADKFGKL